MPWGQNSAVKHRLFTEQRERNISKGCSVILERSPRPRQPSCWQGLREPALRKQVRRKCLNPSTLRQRCNRGLQRQQRPQRKRQTTTSVVVTVHGTTYQSRLGKMYRLLVWALIVGKQVTKIGLNALTRSGKIVHSLIHIYMISTYNKHTNQNVDSLNVDCGFKSLAKLPYCSRFINWCN